LKKILFAASECLPFVKTGGLADVISSLPKAIDPKKVKVKIVLPKYLLISKEFTEKMKFITSYKIELGWRKQYVGIFFLKYEKIEFYFIDNEFLFFGYSPYSDARWDMEKFAFFSKALLTILPVIKFKPTLFIVMTGRQPCSGLFECCI
jgi:starch synthase